MNPLRGTVHSQLEKEVEKYLIELDAELTEEFQRAIELVPGTVWKETKIADFLRAENFDPKNAALRLARCWKTRKALFGKRWLLPMTQTGLGALDPAHIEVLRTGFAMLVTNSMHGTLLVLDFARLPPGEPQIQQEIYFYLFTICACDLTILFLVRGNGGPGVRADTKPNLLGCTASRVKQFFVIQAYEFGREHLLNFLGYQQRRYVETIFQRPCSGHIAADSASATLRLLADHGFDQRCLPREFGGYLDKSKFDSWVRMRLSIEDIMGAAPIGRWKNSAQVDTSTDHRALVVKKAGPKKQLQREKEYLGITRRPNETDKEFAKRKNACYSRRNYHRLKMEILAAEGEVNRCRDINKTLKEENQRLQGLLDDAKLLVQNYLILYVPSTLNLKA